MMPYGLNMATRMVAEPLLGATVGGALKAVAGPLGWAMLGVDALKVLGGLFQKEPGWREQMTPIPTRNVMPELEANSVAARLAQRYGRR